ncbi:iron chelate uptake ABC transporter family permease subunit [Frankia sp. AgB1.9]|uniref:FecCD family ABC transporter permease n=1 Tax=unclassified Frankia TaxID=2632575 RepID=UPI0019347B38|nr:MULTISPECIES: iron chelate uptake ABC transporter family permease subunit [unclassified Frankia]MBL7492065.1 iron chelate uptake ABC transporter family permease subunit [Frankia sp. AgW1.1]MBL7550812.1 iron chelate uptake ABC transporter family permease subunit [Frankia sp. AgB1.9]MBL7625102.1 iron chelate uptake ABC transporter family permease subunit [Frankia sp. AgB1.8]
MDVIDRPRPAAPAAPVRRGGRTGARVTGLAAAVAVLAFVAMASLAVGAKPIPLGTVVHELFHYDGSGDGVIIRTLRVPRTLLGLTVGAGLGLAGAVMQALTRNPLADPGLLGVNAGASAAVVVAIGALGLHSPAAYVWFALAGAAIAAVAVYLLGARGRSTATPVRLALAGAAVSAVLIALVWGLALTNPATFDGYRFWAVGGLAGRNLAVVWQTGPFLLAGAVLALGLARPLNAIALGDEAGRALGVHLGRTRVLGISATTLLCGAATAAAGPIGFVGLTVPHVARAITGPDQRWVLPYSMVLAPMLLLAADIVGRVVARPGEIEAGIVTAFVGAPVLVLLARRRRLAAL